MRYVKFLITISLLLFTSTGIKSVTHKQSNHVVEKIVEEPTIYTIPEFQELEEAIQKQIELTNQLDSLKSNTK